MSSHNTAKRCPNCGNRLFLECDTQGRRFIYFWECSLGCGRQFKAVVPADRELTGSELSLTVSGVH